MFTNVDFSTFSLSSSSWSGSCSWSRSKIVWSFSASTRASPHSLRLPRQLAFPRGRWRADLHRVSLALQSFTQVCCRSWRLKECPSDAPPATTYPISVDKQWTAFAVSFKQIHSAWAFSRCTASCESGARCSTIVAGKWILRYATRWCGTREATNTEIALWNGARKTQ